ncbi:MAG: hypothetical protein IJQ00_05390 [Kiritimatiellae bacterium]|nr:hypothetical protein [Kiritimatiellia bacterium]
MSMRKLTGKAAILAAAIAAGAAIPMAVNAASIAINSVQQRWPWNNKTLTFKSSKGTGQSDLIFLSATSRATALARSSFPIT